MPPSYNRGLILVRLISPNFNYSSSKASLGNGLVRILAVISLVGTYLRLISLVLI